MNNQQTFIALEKLLESLQSDVDIISLASYMATVAATSYVGKFSSGILENRLCEVARHYNVEMQHEAIPNTTLHVLTRGYHAGGHTRIVERWIEFSPENESHSLYVTSDWSDYPTRLKRAIESRDGQIIHGKHDDLLATALELRKVAERFHHVVLHVHMDDIVPILAFGTEEFTRPVYFYNHADHLFWVGISVSDVILDMSHAGQYVTRNQRGRDGQVLPIPMDLYATNTALLEKTSTVLKKQLGLSADNKIIVSVGSPYKYIDRTGEIDFRTIVREILDICESVVFVIVGPSHDDYDWRDLYKRYNSRLKLCGHVPREELEGYLYLSDIYLDSYPIGGGTALSDAIFMEKIIVPIINGYNLYDSYSDLAVPADKVAETVKDYLIGNRVYDARYILSRAQQMHLKKHWRLRLSDIYSANGENHNVIDVVETGYKDVFDKLVEKQHANSCLLLPHRLLAKVKNKILLMRVCVILCTPWQVICVLKAIMRKVMTGKAR